MTKLVSKILSNSENHYSNGKLLITSEYLVLKGAIALAMPVKYGQSLNANFTEKKNVINFTTFVNSTQWWRCSYRYDDLSIIEGNDDDKSSFVREIFHEAKLLNPRRFNLDVGIDIISNLNFDIKWGLGSSSSFISNIAYLFDIDPFDLHNRVSSGSGYDIACARSSTPILYSMDNLKPVVKEVSFFPEFHENIFFVYTGRKMDSSKSVKKFLSGSKDFKIESKQVTELSYEILKSAGLKDFNYFVREHEQLISNVLGEKSVKNLYFDSFEGEVKSLGAWGGDFLMVSSELDYKAVEKYFRSKNLSVLFSFNSSFTSGFILKKSCGGISLFLLKTLLYFS